MADAGFIGPQLSTDPEDIFQSGVADMQALQPGWVPNELSQDTRVMRVTAAGIAAAIDAAQQMCVDAFRALGPLFNTPPIDATQASVQSTWTMIGAAPVGGYTIPAGTQVVLTSATGASGVFVTPQDYTVAESSSVTGTGEVTLIAVDAGAAGSGLAGPATLIDSLGFVATGGIAIVGVTTNGADAETTDAYLDRFSKRLTLMSIIPVTTTDAALFAQGIDGVARAVAINGYNPADSSFGNAGMIAIAAIDSLGAAIGPTPAADLAVQLEAARGQNMVFNVINPTFHLVDSSFTYEPEDDADPAVVTPAAEAAVAAYLDPANWGLPPTGDILTWVNQPTVGKYDVGDIVLRTDGVKRVTQVKLAIHPATLTEADVTLTGVAPLTQAGTITGTAT